MAHGLNFPPNFITNYCKQTDKQMEQKTFLPPKGNRERTLSQRKTGVHLLWGYGLNSFFQTHPKYTERDVSILFLKVIALKLSSAWALGRKQQQQKKTLRKKGRCNLYVYKCQNVKACNPLKRWWGLWLKLGTSPDFNTRKVLTPSSGGERRVLISLSSSLALRYTYSPSLSLSGFKGIILVSVHMDLQ